MRRHKHILSHYNILTADFGELVVCGNTEVLPGDTIQGHSSVFIRLQPQLAPIMHPVRAEVFHFYTPNRILDKNWEEFITGGPDGNNSYNLPTITTTVNEGDPLDYMGVPPGSPQTVLAYPIRAMNKCWNEWFRDQDLQGERAEDDTSMPRAGWRDDYFVHSRPWTQKGPQVSIPIAGQADVKPRTSGSSSVNWFTAGDGVTGPSATAGGAGVSLRTGNASATTTINWADDPGLITDLSSATGIDPVDLRTALSIQRYQENRARYGSRFTEYLRFLGIHASDQRLQRPEMLGGGRAMMMFSEVLQSFTDSAAPASGPLGKMAGHGVSALRNRPWRRFFEEHGWITTFLVVRPLGVYTQGIPRHFLRKVKEDYWQKELEFVGQEDVKNKEIYGPGNDAVFGYVDRYQSYRQAFNRVSGNFRSTLNFHHLAREFTEQPVLNSDFVTCNPTKRIFAEQTQDSMWCLVRNGLVARRLVTRNPHPRIM